MRETANLEREATATDKIGSLHKKEYPGLDNRNGDRLLVGSIPEGRVPTLGRPCLTRLSDILRPCNRTESIAPVWNLGFLIYRSGGRPSASHLGAHAREKQPPKRLEAKGR